jgi:cholesterol oxidase
MSTLRFHERMSGWLSFEQHSYNQAVAAGRRSHNACSQELEIEIDDLDRFLSEPDHAARAEGIVHCDQLGGGLSVQPGSSFNLFVDAGGARHKRMLYRLYLVDTAGRELTLSGFKDLEDDPNLDVWGDTSRLLIRILSGRVEREPIGDESTVATGILYISRVGFLRMLSTFRSSGAIATARATARFNEFFVHELGKVYGGPAVSTSAEAFPLLPNSTPAGRERRPSDGTTWRPFRATAADHRLPRSGRRSDRAHAASDPWRS